MTVGPPGSEAPAASASLEEQMAHVSISGELKLSNSRRGQRIPARNGSKMDTKGEVGFHSLPDQVVHKAVKRGFDLNIMVVGETACGKSTLMDTLFSTSFDEANKSHVRGGIEVFEQSYEVEEKQVKVRLNVVEVLGFGDQLQGEKSTDPILKYITDQLEAYLQEETRAVRALHEYRDTRVHVCLYFVNPTGRNLRPLDVHAMRELGKVVNVIPIIAKADSLTKDALLSYKAKILGDLKKYEIPYYVFPTEPQHDYDDIAEANTALQAHFPFAVCGSRAFDDKGRRVRQYPWGCVDVENENHNDFVRLREALIRLNMTDLWKKTHNVFYAKYRAGRLPSLGLSGTGTRGIKADTGLEEKISTLRHEQSRVAEQKQVELREMFAIRVREKEQQNRAQQNMVENKYEADLTKLREEKARWAEKVATVQREIEELQSPMSPKWGKKKLKGSFFRTHSIQSNTA